jgi:hypothetical protein
MLFSAGIYMLALFATLSENLFVFSAFFLLFFVYLLIKNIIHPKYIIIWSLLLHACT